MFNQRLSLKVVGFILFQILVSCKEDEYDKTATVKFESTQGSYSEELGSINIRIQLDRERNVDTKLKVEWIAKDTTTFYGGDFILSTDVMIKPFNKSSSIQLTIVNDKQIDLDDHILLKITEPSDDKVKLSQLGAEFNLSIKNNDHITPGKFQADLTWHKENLRDNISEINFDLYLQTDVGIDGSGVITNIGTTVSSSQEYGGFDTVYLNDSDPDRHYYIVAYFQKTLIHEIVTYNLALNGMGYNDKRMGGKLDAGDIGAAIFFGPFIKSGNTIFGGRKSQHGEPRIQYVQKSLLTSLVKN